MGWNDARKLVFILFLPILISHLLAFSQVKKGLDEKPLPPAYTIQGALRTKIYYNYILTDTTKVSRVYADSSVVNYERITKYFLTIIQPDNPENGFTKIDVSVDSMHYYFNDGIERYDFTSIERAIPKVLKFEDFKAISIPMSRNFTIVYSPYGEVAKVEGEQITFDRNYIAEIANKTTDTILIHNWTDWLSDFTLQHIGNIFKIIYPKLPVHKDSIWETTMNIRIENLNITDTIKAKVIRFFNNLYTIEGKISGYFIHPKKIKFYKIPNLSLQIEVTDYSGTFAQDLTPTGVVKFVEIQSHLSRNVFEQTLIFTEKILTHYKWELVNQYTFR
ncbi:MAG: hypothetical protein ACUVQ1_07295 [Candidatus Kapaibacteriales bacterium]